MAKQEFREKLTLVVVDKLLIALIIGMVGFFMESALATRNSQLALDAQIQLDSARAQHDREVERLKRSLALSDALLLKRLDKVAEVWDVLNRVQRDVAQLASEQPFVKEYLNSADAPPWARKANLRRQRKPSGDSQQSLKQYLARVDEAVDLLEANRFWLGESLYEKYAEFLHEARAAIEDIHKLTGSGVAMKLAQIGYRRHSISDALQAIRQEDLAAQDSRRAQPESSAPH